MRVATALILVAGLALAGASSARALDLPPPYQPRGDLAGTIHIWGHGAYDSKRDFIGTLVHAWERGFQKFEPHVRFENHLVGTAAAIGAVYTGRGDLALNGREIWPPEISALNEVFC